MVQKLLRVILNPVHTAQLAEYLQAIPTASILKLYAAAASGGFHQRSERCYRPSIHVLEAVLRGRDALNAEAHIVGEPARSTDVWVDKPFVGGTWGMATWAAPGSGSPSAKSITP